jgi:hypothetical protein
MGDLMNEQMRAEFEAAIKKNQLPGGFRPANLDRCAFDDSYVLPEVAGAWWGWQGSREALVLELPPPYPEPDEPEEAIDDSHMDAYHAAKGMRHACANTIEAVGLKVTP